MKIKNIIGENIEVCVEGVNNKSGLVFVMHGLSGNRNQSHIRVIIEAFLAYNYTVVSFNTRHTINKQNGSCELATITSYIEDLNTVINWSADKEWFHDRFILSGHSLGGISIMYYALSNIDKVMALAPISTVVSGHLFRDSFTKNEINNWQKLGYLERFSKSRPGVIKRYSWNLIKDALKYNILEHADKINIPVLMVVGSCDKTTSPRHQKLLFDNISSNDKEYYVIHGAPHSFNSTEHLKNLSKIFNNWIKNRRLNWTNNILF